MCTHFEEEHLSQIICPFSLGKFPLPSLIGGYKFKLFIGWKIICTSGAAGQTISIGCGVMPEGDGSIQKKSPLNVPKGINPPWLTSPGLHRASNMRASWDHHGSSF